LAVCGLFSPRVHTRGDAADDCTRWDVREDDGVGADERSLSDPDRAEDTSAAADDDVFLDDRITVVSDGTDSVVPEELHAGADLPVAADDDSERVREVAALSELDVVADLDRVQGGLHESQRVVQAGHMPLARALTHAGEHQDLVAVVHRCGVERSL